MRTVAPTWISRSLRLLPPPARRKPSSSQGMKWSSFCAGDVAEGQPAVGDLGGEARVGGRAGAEPDGDVLVHVEDGAEGLAQAGGAFAAVGSDISRPSCMTGRSRSKILRMIWT